MRVPSTEQYPKREWFCMADNFRAHYEVLVHKADVDLAAVEHLTGASGIDKELLLFHLQQAVEKYLKARLSFSGLHFEKTHDIIERCRTMRTNLRSFTPMRFREDTIPSPTRKRIRPLSLPKQRHSNSMSISILGF